MTVVSLERSDRSGSFGIYSITASGHATGSTEVCAAVSALMTTLAGYAVNSATPLCIRLASGYSIVKFSGGREAAAVYEAMCIGFMQLAASYSNFLRIEK